MIRSILARKRARLCAVVLAATATASPALLLGTDTTAHADPTQYAALNGVGSDTVQDIGDALTGQSNGINYTPIQSDSASGLRQINSWDAVPLASFPGSGVCITPVVGGASIDRPNGSTQGRKALSRAIDGGNFGSSACGPSTGKSISGLVDFARSSAGPSTGDTGTALTYIPFGRDGVGFAYYAPPSVTTPVTSLTLAQLRTIFSGSATAGTVINGVTIDPCGIQLGSGTYKFWLGITNPTGGASQENTATTLCNNATTTSANGRVEENNGGTLKAKGDALNTEVIVGFSGGSYIAQNNGAAPSTLPTPAGTVSLGSITNGTTVLGTPYTGAPGTTQTPNATFYSDTTFGRYVFTVWDTSRATGIGNNDVKSLFVGSSSVVCSSAVQTTVNKFGFLTPSNCGSTSITGSLISGQF